MDQPAEVGAVMALSQVFTLLFVMIGPIKILGPFAALTRDADEKRVRQIAVRAFVIGLIAVVVGSFVGKGLAFKWGISIPALLLAGAIVFFVVGLNLVLQQYEPAAAAPPPLPAAPTAAAMRIAFPTVVTPYGVAAVIVLLATTQDPKRIAGIMGIAVAIMVLNLLAMLYARSILRGAVLLVLAILGAVLGVLQVGLAVELGLRALRALGVLAA